jgi:hypothetical protein
MAYDLSLYYATLDSPDGPLYSPVPEPGSDSDHACRDEEGNPTLGGLVGVFLGRVLLFGFFAYFWYAV